MAAHDDLPQLGALASAGAPFWEGSMKKLRVLDLFSGIGGFSLGLERTGGFETVAFCEIEKFPRRVLAKHWPEVPCHEDVRKLRGTDIGSVDVICGGYPCQPFSTAGQRRGEKDDRHLWPEFSRLVAELRPTWVIGENVAGHISMGLDDVLSDLEGQGYACRTFVIPACALSAHHRRDRTWVVAYASDVLQPRKLDAGAVGSTPAGSESGDQCEGQAPHGERFRPEFSAGASHVDHAMCARLPQRDVATNASQAQTGKQSWRKPFRRNAAPGWQYWLTEPTVGRVAHGVPNRVDRLKGLGNAVVPQIPELIGYAILEAEAAA